ncbi:hypothetical protein Taro_009722, partial [Colocasia esculenta]|nr:hypothetical protein [Colocasia esculenta]
QQTYWSINSGTGRRGGAGEEPHAGGQERMRELDVLIGSSLAFPPRHSPSIPRRRYQPQRRRRKPSHATPWRPNPSTHPLPRSPLLYDVRRDLIVSSSNACAEANRGLLKYYAALASKLAGSGRLEDFLMVAESVLASDAVAAGNSQFVARIDTELVSRGLSAVLRRGELGEVMEFLGRVDKLGIRPSALFDRVAAEDLADQCRRVWRCGEVEEFVGLLETLAGYKFYIKHIVDPLDVLKILVEKGDANMAIRYASVLPHWQLLFCWIIQEFGKKKDLPSAFNAYEAVKRKLGGFNMFACRSIIDVCGLCGNYLRSRILFKELLAQEITPNAHVFNSLMNVNAHDLSYTFYVYRKMQSLGVIPDVASCNILLKACCLARRVDLAQDIYKEIKDMALSRTLELDVITYSTMIKAFADAKMWQMALKIKEDMLLAGVTPNIVTWSTLIGACANAGLVDQAIQVFEEMLLGGCEPNAQCCNILLHACVESCQYDRAFRFFRSWQETGFLIYSSDENRDSSNMQDGVPSSTGNETSQRTGLSHDPTVKYARTVPFRPTTATFNILMKACGTDYRHAKELMNEMQLIGLFPNHISWSILIDICGSSCNVNGALQVICLGHISAFKTMREVRIKPDVIAYTTAIKACVENKNLKIAYSLFEEMKKYKIQPNLVTYKTLLRARSRYGSLQDVRQCLAIYQDMRKAGYSANDRFLKELLGEWCEGVLCTSTGSTELLGIGDYFRGTDKCNSQSGLIEKVVILLQKDMSENQVVDLRGLSKIEARIVVLSVLRMMKESYAHGDVIDDDMIIMTGLGKAIPGEVNHEQEVQQAITNVLQGELGLDVVVGQGGIPVNKTDSDIGLLRTTRKSSIVLRKDELPESRACVRKPQDLGVLRVTRTSLHNWLQKSKQ